MFTGIVEETGTVKSVNRQRMTLSAHTILQGTAPGDSISINGACLTVIEVSQDSFSVEIMPETLRRTSLGDLRPGDQVNLERALAVGGRLGGHFVQGHVDGTGRVLSLVPESGATLMKVAAPKDVLRYVVEKGFIAVDGISLTVTACDVTSFTVSLVSFTRDHTTLATKRSGDSVNLEVDILAKYIERLIGRESPGITAEFLSEHGFA